MVIIVCSTTLTSIEGSAIGAISISSDIQSVKDTENTRKSRLRRIAPRSTIIMINLLRSYRQQQKTRRLL